MSFQVVFGLKIKSELVQLDEHGEDDQLDIILGLKKLNLVIRYLGLPLGVKLRNTFDCQIKRNYT